MEHHAAHPALHPHPVHPHPVEHHLPHHHQHQLLAAEPPPKLQKRAQLSASIKQDLCEFKRQNPSTTQEQIADYVYRKYSIKINRSTVAKILKQCDKWLSLDVSDAAQANKKRMRAAKHQGLEAGLYDWYEQQEAAHGIRPSDNQVISRAIEMAQELGIQETEFKASQGWLANFKKRYNIKPRHALGEAASLHLVQHPQSVPAEALQHAEAHAALAAQAHVQAHVQAQTHMQLGAGAELSFHQLQQLSQYRPMLAHAGALAQPAALPELMPAEGDQDITNQTAHLCAQRVRSYILKNPGLFSVDYSLRAIEEIIERIGRNACYGQPELQGAH